jgi:acyl-CoA thioester hydrolase
MTISHPAFRDRSEFRYMVQVQTRWSDNDCFGHVNNVVYYSYFDTVVNEYLIKVGGFRPQAAEVIGVVVETMCQYRKSISFPEKIDAGLSVAHIGRTSVRFEVALFPEGGSRSSAAGHFVHVYVDKETRRPVEVPTTIREAAVALMYKL